MAPDMTDAGSKHEIALLAVFTVDQLLCLQFVTIENP